MKAVLLAAGKSTRTYPLTKTRPKPLLPILGKELITYTIDGLRDIVDEWFVVVGYMEEKVKDFLVSHYPDISFTFISQKHLKGTGEAVSLLEDCIGDETFLVLNGDDIYHPEDIKRLIDSNTPYGVLAQKVEDPSRFGVFKTHGDLVVELVEKPQDYVSNLANIGVYKFTSDIFKYKLPLSPRGEYEVTDYVNLLLADEKIVEVMPIDEHWLPVSYPWDVLEAQEYFLKKADVKYKIDPTSQVDPTAFIGPNVVVGPNCKIGANVELENVALFENVTVGDNCRICDSVLAEGVKVNEDLVIDGRESGEVELVIGEKEKKKVVPRFKGVFAEGNVNIKGYHTETTFLYAE